jgi:ketosteroid isomerase-like protein
VSQENLDLTRRANALANAGEWDALAELWHPAAEWRDLGHAPDSPETVHGRAAIRAIWAQWEILELAAEVRGYIDADPWVVCDVRWRARGRGSEVPVEVRVADAYELDGGAIVRAVLGYPDVATALEALPGL